MYSLSMGQGPMLVKYDNGPPSLEVTNLESIHNWIQICTCNVRNMNIIANSSSVTCTQLCIA